MGKGQVWSFDLVVGMLVFLLAVGTIYSFLNTQSSNDPTPPPSAATTPLPKAAATGPTWKWQMRTSST